MASAFRHLIAGVEALAGAACDEQKPAKASTPESCYHGLYIAHSKHQLQSRTREKRTWLLLGLVGLAFALRVAGLEFQSLWRDEIDAVRFATQPWRDLLGMFVTPGQNGPLYYLALRPWLTLAGLSEYALRFFSVFFGTLAVPLVYRVARRLFPSLAWLGLIAAALTATSPYLIWYGQEGKMYSMVLILVLLSMDRYLAALERGGWQRWLLHVAFTGAAVYVHFVAALIVPVQLVGFLLVGRETRRVRWKGWLASMAALVLPYLPLLRWQVPLAVSPAETGYPFVPLRAMLISLLTSYSLGPISGGLRWAAFLFGLLLLAAVWIHQDRGWRLPSLGLLACWLFVPVIALFLVTLVRPMYTARYLIFIVPAYLLYLAAGTVAIAQRSRLLAGLLVGALLVSNAMGLWRQGTTPLKADFRAATGYVASRMSPGDLLVFQIPYGRHSFDFYLDRYREWHALGAPEVGVAPRRPGEHEIFLPLVVTGQEGQYRWVDGLYTNGGANADAVALSMERLTEGTENVWLVATEVEMWDSRGLVQAWLELSGGLVEQADFVGVSVYKYRLQ